MLDKVATVVMGLLLALFAGWVIANAGVGIPAPGISNPVWLNSEPGRGTRVSVCLPTVVDESR